MGLLPLYVTKNTMPNINDIQLKNRITRLSLQKMYDYKVEPRVSETKYTEIVSNYGICYHLK